ncbi:efflux RND transporter periplasmic adaptor subunit [Dyadobacter jiangsuensis]|uniref:CusB/HlyD membrane fusion family barrel-sandwich protein n=1 Tax=Dyadobacter jiangsuensis TaxID=1591085 RepID=A0A2P8FAQ2_9BACT|nr:HlyD family efflux transporter periplasmic adaptor subunit [Dyadobacter jiangsuensis]PSL18784.1 CusB/HlyD membrane fusion family barrel-sandwich protein [Dyadobacter jiangsuensis]
MKSNCTAVITVVLLTCLGACSSPQETRPVRKSLRQAVFASGHLEQENEYVIAATAEGTITELHTREGDQIGVGQVLVRIKSDVPSTQLRDARIVYNDARKNAAPGAPQLAQLESQIAVARAQLDQDRINYERYTELRTKNSASQLELEKALLAYKTSRGNLVALEENYSQVQDALRLNAARSLQQVKTQQAILSEYATITERPGIVLDVLKKKGELVRKGEVIARIGSGRHIIRLFIAEDDITRLGLGQRAIIQMNNYPDTTFTATVTRILPAFDQTAQSYSVEAEFVSPPPLLLSGTQLQANITQDEIRSVLVIPSAALVRGQFVQMRDGKERAIRTGQKVGSWVEVKAGLTEKDIILLPENDKDAKQGVELPGT